MADTATYVLDWPVRSRQKHYHGVVWFVSPGHAHQRALRKPSKTASQALEYARVVEKRLARSKGGG